MEIEIDDPKLTPSQIAKQIAVSDSKNQRY